MGWKTLPRNYLEVQLDSLGLERRFENGIPDGNEVANTERLIDYWDDHTRLHRPKKVAPPKVIRPKMLPPNACPGSNEPVNGDLRVSACYLICSRCQQRTCTYRRRRPLGEYRSLHFLADSQRGHRHRDDTLVIELRGRSRLRQRQPAENLLLKTNLHW